LEEVCSKSNLAAGTYYAMVDFYEGSGTYNISLSCFGEATTTTTKVYGTTTTEVTTTKVSTTTTEGTRVTTTTAPGCGYDGYCEYEDVECESGYEECSENDGDCDTDEKCCCPSGPGPEPGPGYGIVVGLFLTFVLIVLVYFYIKSKSPITYEKLYKKWSRVFVG